MENTFLYRGVEKRGYYDFFRSMKCRLHNTLFLFCSFLGSGLTQTSDPLMNETYSVVNEMILVKSLIADSNNDENIFKKDYKLENER